MHTHYLGVSPTLKIKREKRRRVKKQRDDVKLNTLMIV